MPRLSFRQGSAVRLAFARANDLLPGWASGMRADKEPAALRRELDAAVRTLM